MTVSSTNTVFSSFVVSIASITLTRSDGYVFTVLGANGIEQRADLTRITDISELLEAPAVPNGTYKTGTITLDLTTPIINVVTPGGTTVAATPVDTSGTPLTTATLTFNLDPNKPLVINTHQGTHFGFEFDLAASTILSTGSSPLQVVFTPVVVASVVLPNNNPVRVRGLYLTADQGGNSFILNSSPFDDQYSATYSGVGAVNVSVDANTTYDLNGVVYTGANGLAQIGRLQLNAFVAVVGAFTDVSQVTPTLHATQVYAGNSLEGLSFDRVVGYVSARAGNSLTVHGALVTERDSVAAPYSYLADIPVTVGSSTIVNIDGTATTGLTNQAISIGQQIEVIGQAALDPATAVVTSMDATGGEVRLQPTRLWGTFVSATPGSLSMSLQSIGLFDYQAFNFAGTGAAGADATAANYSVNSGSLDLSATPINNVLRVDGLVTAFGSAPPDFSASAVAAAPAIDSVLQVEWIAPGTPAPFASNDNTGFIVNLSNSLLGGVHQIDTGRFSQDLLNLSASPLIVPDPTNGTNYSVGAGTALVLDSFTTFAAFMGQVTTELTTNTKTMRKLVAVGRYDPGTNTFTAKRINLVEE